MPNEKQGTLPFPSHDFAMKGFRSVGRHYETMITRSMKRIVLSIIESAREVSDNWKANSTRKSAQSKAEFIKAMSRLERAVDRLDRIADAEAKTHR